SEKENKAYCLAKKGLYLVYLPYGGEHKIKLLEADKVQTIRWYNTRDGKHVAKSDFSGTITAPDNNDWLAILE
ncbi:MAG: putative collagen-binding domain-containing protein, partial [Akkermansiaceae bacterium]